MIETVLMIAIIAMFAWCFLTQKAFLKLITKMELDILELKKQKKIEENPQQSLWVDEHEFNHR